MEYTSVKSIYSLSDFLTRIKEATDDYNKKMKTAPYKTVKRDKLFGCRIPGQWEVQLAWENQIKMICAQAKAFGYTPDQLGINMPDEEGEVHG